MQWEFEILLAYHGPNVESDVNSRHAVVKVGYILSEGAQNRKYT